MHLWSIEGVAVCGKHIELPNAYCPCLIHESIHAARQHISIQGHAYIAQLHPIKVPLPVSIRTLLFQLRPLCI
jgi:hypothetical protein